MHLSFRTLALLFAVTVATASLRLLKRDVCIIGGGASGTYAAVRLKEEGYSVAVLEKEDHLGGHTVTYTDPDTNTSLNMGVVVYHDLPLVRGYFERLGVDVQKGGFAANNIMEYDFSTGMEVSDYVPSSQEEIGRAIQQYGHIVATQYSYLSLAYNLPDPVPAELLVPFQEFIKANEIEPMMKFISRFAGGIGDLWERPTLYGIKAMSALLIKAIQAGFIISATGDNRCIYRGAETYLDAENLVFNARIQRIMRCRSGGVQVAALTPDAVVIVKAKKLIMAVPPLLDSLCNMRMSISQTESRLFGKFFAYTYGSSVITYSGTNLTGTLLDNTGANNPFFLPTFPGSFNFAGLAGTNDKISTYFATPEGVTMVDEEIRDLIRAQLKKLARSGKIPDGEVNFKFLLNHYPYHLSVSADDVAAGFYRDLYALQGERSTFWTGATFVDNDSSLIWTWMEETLLPQVLASMNESGHRENRWY